MNKPKTNGCGAMTGMWRWLRPPHYQFFKEACALHDWLYEHGGSEADRLKADQRLYDDMVKHSITYFKGRSRGSQTWFVVLSYTYYKAVRLFGRSQFNYK